MKTLRDEMIKDEYREETIKESYSYGLRRGYFGHPVSEQEEWKQDDDVMRYRDFNS